MGSKKSNPADVYRPKMEAAATAAETISPQEQEYNAFQQKLWDMYSGKTPFDLAKMPNAGIVMPMYEQAKARSDRGRIGKGLAYGGKPGEEGYNANLIGAIDEQNQSERERDAAGAVEQQVSDTFAGLPGRYLGVGQADQDRRDSNYNRYAQMYGMEINKPKKPKWWESLLGGAAQVGAGWASSGFAT
ncbi:MAG: hypothetical protein ABL984_11935 [Pyrinomonadaceae bacterium]